ncbi:hypothetical protein G7Y89_g3223 [Cudoniella acicularis]|uniref:Uncharacterized protein n=1 Tax=Cudoniella acicularis TaxID=354080 RepID=A0A8H4W5D5_9HELO|nr:hypothetical protein G7Y89_g3223 [Cudoniella acicularis]
MDFNPPQPSEMSQPTPPDNAAAHENTPQRDIAAPAYQQAMPQEPANPSISTTPSPAPAIGTTNAPSPIPPRVGTPGRNVNGNDVTSRATSQHPDPAPTIPKEAPPHGAPTRQYLNSKVTGPLMEGMKHIAKEQPKDPLRVLGEYLLQRSKEVEGT